MVRISNTGDSSSIRSQLTETAVDSAPNTPHTPTFFKVNTIANNDSTQSLPSRSSLERPDSNAANSTRTSSPRPPCSTSSQHACPRSRHPGDPLACPDLEEPPSQPVPGWPTVSKLMSETPEFISFNRFSDIQIKSLLYYQAQIEAVQIELKEEEWDDYRHGDGNVSEYYQNARLLVKSKSKQWKLMTDLRVLLKEYNKALLQFSQVAALPKPETHNVNSLMKWLKNPEAGNLCIGGGGEQNTWGDIYGKGPTPKTFWEVVWSLIWSEPEPLCKLDLAATNPKAPLDSLSRWVASSFIPWWAHRRELRKRDKVNDTEKSASPQRPKNTRDEIAKDTLTRYSGASIVRFTSSLTTLVACLLPTIAVTVLSHVHGLPNLLGCLAGFAFTFAAGLIFLGTASRIEIFGATAAFSAVLVVFISVPMVIVPPSGKPYVVSA